ncbi:MAG: polymer-forming cytoskeletal protein [Acidobacteriota bacterium]|nr:polymer-forming cytoskeletal protein [Acidobacteriota bacterium]
MMRTNQHPTTAGTPADTERPFSESLAPGVTAVGRGIQVKGQLMATEHVIIEGVVEGAVLMPDYGVAISGAAHVQGEVCARTVTVLGRVDGNVTASHVIELRATSVVTGRLVSPCLIIEEGAHFHGSVVPNKTDAAMAVVRHRMQLSKDAPPGRVPSEDVGRT